MKAQGIVLWDLVEKYFRVSKRVSWLKFWDNFKVGIWQKKCLLKWIEVLSPLDLG